MTWKLKASLKARCDQETGTIIKNWGGKISIALIAPTTYHVAMGNLALHMLYKLFNDAEGLVCERAFLPDEAELPEYRRSQTPILSLESQRPLSEFDLIALSISFENAYLGILPLLELAKIPHRREARDHRHPLLILGGAAPTLNPLPAARIVDATFRGEVECFASELIPLLQRRPSREELLAALRLMPGVVTEATLRETGEDLHRITPPRHVVDLDASLVQSVIHSRKAAFGEMHLIEAERGCSRTCQFCTTPIIYGRARRRSAKAIMAMVDQGLPFRKRMGIIGADFLRHPACDRILQGILERGATFSLSSLRADAITAERASLLQQAGHQSVALGVEAGSERLRSSLRKGLSDSRLMETVLHLAHAGITQLRLYFMIGLPEEDESDVRAIAELATHVLKELQRAGPKKQRRSSVDLTITPFIPKPGTPFAQAPFAHPKRLKETLNMLKGAIAKIPGLHLRSDSLIDAELEYTLANADGSALWLLEAIHREKHLRTALKAWSADRSAPSATFDSFQGKC